MRTWERLKGVPEVEAREERTAMELKGWTTHQPPMPPREAVAKEMWGGRGAGVGEDIFFSKSEMRNCLETASGFGDSNSFIYGRLWKLMFNFCAVLEAQRQ